jgi:hypothetical protein
VSRRRVELEHLHYGFFLEERDAVLELFVDCRTDYFCNQI